jgi:hypothetical protein
MDTPDKPAGPPRRGITVVLNEAPFIYTDGATTFGVTGGIIQIELAAHIIVPTPDGGTKTEIVTTAHLRCSQKAAADLRVILDRVLEIAQNPAATVTAGTPEGRLN